MFLIIFHLEIFSKNSSYLNFGSSIIQVSLTKDNHFILNSKTWLIFAIFFFVITSCPYAFVAKIECHKGSKTLRYTKEKIIVCKLSTIY